MFCYHCISSKHLKTITIFQTLANPPDMTDVLHIVTQRLKTRHLSFLAFLLNHILHCICFKILLQDQTILLLTHLIRTIKKSKKWIESLRYSGPDFSFFVSS